MDSTPSPLYLAREGPAEYETAGGGTDGRGREAYGTRVRRPGVHHERLITGLAAVFGGLALALTAVAVVYSPAVIVLALAFGAAAYFMWYQASGRLAARVYRSVEQQAAKNAGRSDGGRTRRASRTERGGFGAGPREDWTPPGGRGSGRRQRARRNGQGKRRQRRTAPSTTEGPSRKEAFRTLGVEPGADEATIKQAYRQKVKEVHPDTEGGDEERFKQVNRAYERLTD